MPRQRSGSFATALSIVAKLFLFCPIILTFSFCNMNRNILSNLLLAALLGFLPFKVTATVTDETPQWWLQRSIQTESIDSALVYASTAISLDPQYAAAYTQRGRVLKYTGQYRKALKDFSTAIKYAPDYAIAYLEKAKVYLTLGKEAKALKCLNSANQIDGNLVEVYQLRSLINRQKGELDAVIYDYSTLIRLYPTLPRVYLQRAQVYFLLGETEKAKLDTQIARRLILTEQIGDKYNAIAREQPTLVALLDILNEGTKQQVAKL